VDKLKHHLHMSKLHYMLKPAAAELAEAHEWEYHDSEEEEIQAPPGLGPLSGRSGAPLALRHSGSHPRSPRSRSVSSVRPRRDRNLLAIGAAYSSRSGTDRLQETEYRRVIIAVESSIRAARHAERLSASASEAFNLEARKLETALETLQQLL